MGPAAHTAPVLPFPQGALGTCSDEPTGQHCLGAQSRLMGSSRLWMFKVPLSPVPWPSNRGHGFQEGRPRKKAKPRAQGFCQSVVQSRCSKGLQQEQGSGSETQKTPPGLAPVAPLHPQPQLCLPFLPHCPAAA